MTWHRHAFRLMDLICEPYHGQDITLRWLAGIGRGERRGRPRSPAT